MSKIYKISSLLLFLILTACSQQVISDQLLRECKQEHQQQRKLLERLQTMHKEYPILVKERLLRKGAYRETLFQFLDSMEYYHAQIERDFATTFVSLEQKHEGQIQSNLNGSAIEQLLENVYGIHFKIKEKYIAVLPHPDFLPNEVAAFNNRRLEEITAYHDKLMTASSADFEGLTIIETKILLNSMLICSYNIEMLYYQFIFAETSIFWRYHNPLDRPEYSTVFPHFMHHRFTPLNPQKGQAFQVDSYLMYHINYEFLKLDSVKFSLNGKAFNLPIDRYPLGAQTFAKKDLAKIQDLVIEAKYTDRWERTNILKDTFYYQTCTN